MNKFILSSLVLCTFWSCQREIPVDLNEDNPPPINDTITQNLRGPYIESVESDGRLHQFYYNDKNQLVKVSNAWSLIHEMYLSYKPDGRLNSIIYDLNPSYGPYDNGYDSLIYDQNQRVHVIIKQRDVEVLKDTFFYNPDGLIERIMSDVGTGIYRTVFEYDTNSNLIKYTHFRRCYTPLEQKIREVTYSNYDNKINPYHKLVMDKFFIPDIYDLNQDNLDGEDYIQLSKNNPGLIYDYQTAGTVALNGSSRLTYLYDSTGRPITVLDIDGRTLTRNTYVFR